MARNPRRVVIGALWLALAAVSETGWGYPQPPTVPVRLSDAIGVNVAPAVAPATPLDSAEVARILERLLPSTRPGGSANTSVPDPLRPLFPKPPKGVTAGTFPPTPLPTTTDRSPLRVVHNSPVGSVATSGGVSLGFSRAVVPIAAVDDVQALRIPVRMTPQPPGRWRWVDPQTLLFESEGRLPMATEYAVEVPGDTEAADGTRMAAPVRWTFSTGAPAVVRVVPEDGATNVPRNAVFFLQFDQKVSPADVLPTIKATVGATPIALRLATADEVRATHAFDGDEPVTVEGRVVGFAPAVPPPAGTVLELSAGPQIGSAEGPRRSTAPFAWHVQTRESLKVVETRCERCDADSQRYANPADGVRMVIAFNNPIDAETFRPDMVRIEPPVPTLVAAVEGWSVVLSGVPAGAGQYRITLAGSIADEAGQILDRQETRVFTVADWEPLILGSSRFSSPLVVLNASGRLDYSFWSINCRSLTVRAYAVGLADWESRTWTEPGFTQGRSPSMTRVLPVTVRDTLVETRIDLRPALPKGTGHLVLTVEPEKAVLDRWKRLDAPYRIPAPVWLEVTHLGVTAVTDEEQVVGLMTSLDDGRPLRGATLTQLASGRTVTSDDQGVAVIRAAQRNRSDLVARYGSDWAILPAYGPNRSAESRDAWFVFTDRGVYRSGETIHAKGWMRTIDMRKGGDVQGASGHPDCRVAFHVADRTRRTIAEGVVDLNDFGAFDISVPLPPKGALNEAEGAVYIRIRDIPNGPDPVPLWTDSSGQPGWAVVQVIDYVRPNIELDRRPDDIAGDINASSNIYVVGEPATVAVTAGYFGGGNLSGALVRWTANTLPAQFAPPNQTGYRFGVDARSSGAGRDASSQNAVVHVGRTDSKGRHELKIDFLETNQPRPFIVSLSGQVSDVDRRQWATSRSMFVHPARVYVGLGAHGSLVAGQSEPATVDVIVADIAGNVVAGRPVTVRATRYERVRRSGGWFYVAAGEEQCDVRSGTERVTCQFTPPGREGRYVYSATVTDDAGRTNQTEIERGSAASRPVRGSCDATRQATGDEAAGGGRPRQAGLHPW